MSKSSKIFIGILSFLPVLVTAGLFVTMFLDFTNSWGDLETDSAPSMMFQNFRLFFLLMMGLFVLSIGLLIYFIVQVVRNKKMDSTERAIWILVFVLGGAISYPIYWYLKIWKEEL